MQLSVLTGLLAAMTVLAAGGDWANAASPYPSRPVRMIVPFQPGGASDFVGRIIQPKLAEVLGQNVVVENRVGASGYVGVETAAGATPDGYTFLLGNVGTMAINASVFPKFKVKPLDAFIGVTQVVDVPLCVAVHPSLPVKSIKELVDYAKARPGKLNYAAAGAGSNGRLTTEYWMQKVGVEIVMVAYKGGAGGASLGLVQGETQVSFLSTPSIFPFVKQGRLRLLAVIARERLNSAPDVPTMAEAGFPDLTVGSWQGVYVPKGTPQPVVKRLFPAVQTTMQDAEVKRRLGTASAVVVLSKSPEDFYRFWKGEHDRWAAVVKSIGAQAQK
jgi:tripartite-type tricarboxylate transporter receptor subunit TctC